MNDELSPRARELVDLGRAESPSEDDRARVKRSVLLRVSAATVAISSATSTSMASASASGTALAGASAAATKLASVASIAISLALGGSAAVGVVAWQGHAERSHAALATKNEAKPDGDAVKAAPENARAAVESPPNSAVPTPPEPRLQAETPAAPAAPRTHATATGEPVQGSAAPAAQLESELPLLRAAQEALRVGDSARAIGLLNEHARRFPNGALAEERRAVHAIASCRLDARGEGPAEAEAFVRSNPASPLADRVREACARGR
jgi:hypothetical protein